MYYVMCSSHFLVLVMPPPKYQLSGVAVVTRHGDRSSLNQFPNHKRPNILCRLSSVTDHHRTAASKFIKSMDKLVAAQNRPSHYREFDLYPDSKHCGIAQLTARGVLQMISLGEQLRARYVGEGLLFQGKTNVAKKLYVRTTNYERTFQSAMAVMHGFLPSISMSSVSMDVTKNLYHCSELYSNLSCSCPMAFQPLSLADKNPQVTDDEKRLFRTNVQKVAPFLTDYLRPAPLLESLLPYVCHNLTFPCFNGSCVTWQTINTLWNITDSQEIRHAKSNHSALSSRLLAHPLLSEIVARFFNIMRYNTQKHAKRFFLFSGHDSTLLPLLQALSIMDGRRPPLASNLVFELYGVRQKQFYIRILYNGRDWTQYLSFCPPSTLVDGLCPMDNFAYFVLYENEKSFGKSYANACA